MSGLGAAEPPVGGFFRRQRWRVPPGSGMRQQPDIQRTRTPAQHCARYRYTPRYPPTAAALNTGPVTGRTAGVNFALCCRQLGSTSGKRFFTGRLLAALLERRRAVNHRLQQPARGFSFPLAASAAVLKGTPAVTGAESRAPDESWNAIPFRSALVWTMTRQPDRDMAEPAHRFGIFTEQDLRVMKLPWYDVGLSRHSLDNSTAAGLG